MGSGGQGRGWMESVCVVDGGRGQGNERTPVMDVRHGVDSNESMRTVGGQGREYFSEVAKKWGCIGEWGKENQRKFSSKWGPSSLMNHSWRANGSTAIERQIRFAERGSGERKVGSDQKKSGTQKRIDSPGAQIMLMYTGARPGMAWQPFQTLDQKTAI